MTLPSPGATSPAFQTSQPESRFLLPFLALPREETLTDFASASGEPLALSS